MRDNYLQTQAITVTHQLGAHLIDRTARFMRAARKATAGLLDRAVEIPARRRDHRGATAKSRASAFSRPELAVLLSYSKIVLYDELLASDLPDDPYFVVDLIDYFPKPLRKTYAEQIKKHRLRREIVTTVMTNDLVNRVGINFVYEVREKTGMPAEEIAKAYVVAREIFGMQDIWKQIEALDNKVPALLQSTMLVECGRLIEREAVWFLREGGHPLKIEQSIADYGKGVKALVDKLYGFLSDADRDILEERAAEFTAEGAPTALARRIAGLRLLAPACDIVRIASEAKLPVEQVAETYFRVGERFGFDWLRRAAGQLSTDTAWDKLAVTAIVDDFFGHQGDLTTRIINGTAASKDGAARAIDSWAETRRPMVSRSEQLIIELKAAGTPDFAMLAVANRQMKSMVAG